jgi:predicted DNA-binding transcriptional regulator AlpA
LDSLSSVEKPGRWAGKSAQGADPVIGVKRSQPTLQPDSVACPRPNFSECFAMPFLMSVPQFCTSHGLSRSFFYKLIQQGKGPRPTKLGARTLVSVEAAAEWRARMEAAISQGGAK